jgi:hypothetical protein
MGAHVIHYPCYGLGHFISYVIAQLPTVFFGFCFEFFNLGGGIFLCGGNSGFGRFFYLLLSF